MKATMIRKASSSRDWLQIAGKDLHTPVEVKIEKTIKLTQAEFKKFESDFFEDSELIKSNQDKMFVDENEIWHCIKITAPHTSYSILVESEGYNYARYTAIITK